MAAVAVLALLLQGLAGAAHTPSRLPAGIAEAMAAGLPVVICTGGRTVTAHMGVDGLPTDAPDPASGTAHCPLCTLVQIALPSEPVSNLPLEVLLAAVASMAPATVQPTGVAPARIHGNRGPPASGRA